MATGFEFTIVINADDFEDALAIYGNVLRTKVKGKAGAAITYRAGDATKILSTDNIKTGEGRAGASAEIHPLR